MESSIRSPPRPKPKLTTVLSESRQLINSHRRQFFSLFCLLMLVLFPAGIAYSSPGGSKDNGRVAQFLTVRTLLKIFIKIIYLPTLIFVTSFALHTFNGKPASDLNCINKSMSASFFPLLATNLLQLAISFLVILGFAVIFGCVMLFAFSLGFQIDPKSPFVPLLAITVVGVPSVLVVAYLNFVSWGLVTAVVVAESTWGLAALKRSKSLVDENRSLAVILFLIFAVSYTIVGLVSKAFAVAGLEERPMSVAMGLFSVAQLFMIASLSSMVKLYEIVVTTLFYVFSKAVHEEGQYSKLAIVDSGSELGGYYQV